MRKDHHHQADNILAAREPVGCSSVCQNDCKPLLKALGALCLFFCALAVLAAFGAMLMVAARNLTRLL